LSQCDPSKGQGPCSKGMMAQFERIEKNDLISKDQQRIESMIQFRGIRKDFTRILMKGKV
jgi:hypothetical protein